VTEKSQKSDFTPTPALRFLGPLGSNGPCIDCSFGVELYIRKRRVSAFGVARAIDYEGRLDPSFMGMEKLPGGSEMDISLAAIIPCYNEELTIWKVVSDFKKIIPEARIYVFDNNSKDKTAEIAKSAGAVVIKEKRQGNAVDVH